MAQNITSKVYKSSSLKQRTIVLTQLHTKTSSRIAGLGCSLEFFAETAEMKEALDNLKETAQDDKEREILYQKISTILGYYQVNFTST